MPVKSKRFGIRPHVAFTILELLVVVAVIAILVAILVPSLRRARQQAFQVKCAAHLRAMGQGILYYTLDPNNGNGYLPHHAAAVGHGSRAWWVTQIMPYVKFRRSTPGSREAFFRCPADDDPVYVLLTGPEAPKKVTLEDKIRTDTGSATSGGRRGPRPVGTDGRPGPMIEPLSYAFTGHLVDPAPAPHSTITRKLAELERPHCQLVLADTTWEVLWSGFHWPALINFYANSTDPAVRKAYRRHFGGMDPRTNGPNILFADMHVSWHSLADVSDRLLCCQDFGNPWTTTSLNARVQAERCGSTSESRR